MKFLTVYKMNIVEILDSSQEYYERFIEYIQKGAKKHAVSSLLISCRSFILKRMDGENVIRYLLYHLSNKVIKKQLGRQQCPYLQYFGKFLPKD